MTDAAAAPQWSYRFTRPDEAEIAVRDLGSDAAATAVARELSRSGNTPVVVHRLQKAANSWLYVSEVDERPDET